MKKPWYNTEDQLSSKYILALNGRWEAEACMLSHWKPTRECVDRTLVIPQSSSFGEVKTAIKIICYQHKILWIVIESEWRNFKRWNSLKGCSIMGFSLLKTPRAHVCTDISKCENYYFSLRQCNHFCLECVRIYF